jgi:hypothetical protein
VRRNAAPLTILVTEAGVVALAVFFHLRPRVAILAAFTDFGTDLPPAPAVALSPWLLPSAIGVAIACTLAGLALPLGRRRSTAVMGAGLVVVSLALIFAIGMGFGAIFQAR